MTNLELIEAILSAPVVFIILVYIFGWLGHFKEKRDDRQWEARYGKPPGTLGRARKVTEARRKLDIARKELDIAERDS